MMNRINGTDVTGSPGNGRFDPNKYGKPSAAPSRPVPVAPRPIENPVAPRHIEKPVETITAAPGGSGCPAPRIADDVNVSGLKLAAWPTAETVPVAPRPIENPAAPRPIEKAVETITAAPGGSGRPAPRIADNVNVSGLKFTAWPTAETRSRAAGQKRTVSITGFPIGTTFADLSAICAKAGIVERFEFKDHGRALVHFLDQEMADRFLARTGNGVDHKGGAVFVDSHDFIDVIPGRIREAITERGIRRVIRIVGIESEKQMLKAIKELVPGTDHVERFTGMSPSQLLRELAVGAFGESDLEMAAVRKNNAGFLEGRIVFGKTDTAMRAFAVLRKCDELELCNITHGDDPCE